MPVRSTVLDAPAAPRRRRHEKKDLEERHRAGYRQMPSAPGEFKVQEVDRAWGDEAWSNE